ncbi:Putative DNA-binding domain-containing protein [Eubacterium aggregans]|uniref:Putative DNA-binding domain-containing protein n=2 Tax=Eubacterium aggregans TaxID=81409 RepID=A0A1H4EL07_9FIRM|nr:Putative DNA-binding domain-containing protein [Eubacterium aggregans]
MFNSTEMTVMNIIDSLPNVNEKSTIDFKIAPYPKNKMADFISDVIAMLNSIEGYRKDKYIIIGIVDETKYAKGISIFDMPDDSHFQNLLDKIAPRPIVETGTVQVDSQTYGYIYIPKDNKERVYEVSENYGQGTAKEVKVGQSFIRMGSKTSVISNENRSYIKFQKTYIEPNIKNKALSRIVSTNNLSLEIAKSLLESDIDKRDVSWAEPEKNSFSVITGDYGSGKTYCLEIMYLRLLQSYNTEQSTIIPIWISNWDLQANDAFIRDILDLNIFKEIVFFYDELESKTQDNISRILEETKYLLLQHHSISFIFSSRNIPVLNDLSERKAVKLLTQKEICVILNLMDVNKVITPCMLERLDKEIQKTISRPFFTFLFGNLMKNHKITEFYSYKDMFIKKILLTNFIDRVFDREDKLLDDFISIAVRSIERQNGEFHLAEVDIQCNINDINRKGLLIYNEESKLYKFNLPIIAQWLASESLIRGKINTNCLIDTSQHLYRWLYPLIYTLYRLNNMDSLNSIFSPIIEKFPAIMGTIIKNGVEQELTIGARDVTVDKIKDVINLFKSNFSEKDFIFKFPINISLEYCEDTPSFEINEKTDTTLCSSRFPIISNKANGNYYAAYKTIINRIESILKNIYLIKTDMYAELIWQISCKNIDDSSLRNTPVVIKEIFEKNSNLNSNLKSLYEKMLEDGKDSIIPPWPFGDIPLNQSSGWVWDMFSEEKLLEKVVSIYKSAIHDYKYIVENCFDSFKNIFPTYQLIPFELKGILYQRDKSSHPSLYQYKLALPYNEQSRVSIEWGQDLNYILEKDSDHQKISKAIERNRSNTSHLLSYSRCQGYLDVFGFKPITTIVIEWLIDDFKKLGWLDSGFSSHLRSI